MLTKLLSSAFIAVIAVGVTACSGGHPLPSPVITETVLMTENAQAPCDHLDFEGDPAQPDSVTLTCKDGDKIVIPGPIKPGDQVGESIARPDGGAVAGDDGRVYLASESGKHYAWYFLMTEEGEFRVWHDDQIVQRMANGERTISKIAMRNFSQENNATSYHGW